MIPIVIVTALVVAFAGPAAAQERDRGDRGALGGVLDTLGGLLGGASQAHGTVVLAREATIVFRTDDGRTLRVDTAGLDPETRRRLQAGQAATLSARGAGGDVVTATEVRVDAEASGRAFETVRGTVQERTAGRLVFRTREGLTLPVETARIRGLPSFSPGEPATLYYEQGPRQEIVAVWVEPGPAPGGAATTEPPPAAPMPSASPAGRQTLEGTVETLEVAGLTLQLGDGRRMAVDASGLDRGELAAVRPGDRVTVTGSVDPDRDRFIAASLRRVP